MTDEFTRRNIMKSAGASLVAGLAVTTTAAAKTGGEGGSAAPETLADPAVIHEAMTGHEDLLADLSADDLLEEASTEQLVESAETIESGTATVEGVGETPVVQLTTSVDGDEVDVNLFPERDVAFAVHQGDEGPIAYGAEANGDCPRSNCYWVCTWIQGCFCHCLSL